MLYTKEGALSSWNMFVTPDEPYSLMLLSAPLMIVPSLMFFPVVPLSMSKTTILSLDLFCISVFEEMSQV